MFDPTASSLAGVDPVTLQTWLTQAQAAMAALATGTKTVNLSYGMGDGHRTVTYQRTDMAQLRAWIALLQAQLGVVCRPRRAFSVAF